MTFEVNTLIELEGNSAKKIEQWVSPEETRYYVQYPVPMLVPIGGTQGMPMMQDVPIQIEASSVEEAFANYETAIRLFIEEAQKAESKPKLIVPDAKAQSNFLPE